MSAHNVSHGVFTVERTYPDVTPQRVFEAFSSEAGKLKWFSGPRDGMDIVEREFDFRVGGAYRFAYEVQGGQVMTVNGIYRSIAPPSRIVFSWNIEPPDENAGLQSEVIVAIAPRGDGSELHIRHEKLTQPGAGRRHSEGWRGALDQLEALLSSAGVVA